MKIFSFFFLVIICQNGLSQENTDVTPLCDSGFNSLGQKYIVSKAVSFHVTGKASEWKGENRQDSSIREFNQFKGEKNEMKASSRLNSLYPEMQSKQGTRALTAPLVNFDGQDGDDTNPPPDPSGAAGPNHYVQAVNWSFQVFDKTGIALTSPVSLSFFGGIMYLGDPIVKYDKHADRWVIAYMDLMNDIVMAVSETSDPTGAFYVYTYTIPDFPDYPKFSVWWDGYYMTANSLQNAAVFERTEMLAGNPSAQMISLSLPTPSSATIRSALPSDADGPIPPNGTPCNFFLLEDDAGSGTQDQIKIYEMITNWVTPANTQLAVSQQLPIAPFDGFNPTEKIPQPTTMQKLDGMEGIFMYRAQHRRWIGYNTIVLTHTVDVGNTTAIRWYELRDNDDGIWYQYQFGTYMPDSAHRWIPSIAMDDEGNIGLAYSHCDSSAMQYPGIRYTGRMSNDPLGEMTYAEETAIAGVTYQNNNNRFGDYTALSIDPDGSTFWHTGEYMGFMYIPKTRIYSFQLNVVAGSKDENASESWEILHRGTEIKVNLSGVTTNDNIIIELIGMDGKVISSSTQMPIQNSISHSFETSSLSSGIYFVRAGNTNFQKSGRIFIGD